MLALPWVDRVGPGIPCEGIRWSKVSIRHIHSMCGEPPEGIPDHAHCSFQAKWHFVALDGDDSFATTGNYCWHHLMQQMAHQEEQERSSSGRRSSDIGFCGDGPRIVRVAQFLRRNYVPGTAPTRWVDAPGDEMDAWLAEAEHIVGMVLGWEECSEQIGAQAASAGGPLARPDVRPSGPSRSRHIREGRRVRRPWCRAS